MTDYTTFKTVCLKCNKKLELTAFNVGIGLHYFALCPKHEKELIKLLIKLLAKWEVIL